MQPIHQRFFRKFRQKNLYILLSKFEDAVCEKKWPCIILEAWSNCFIYEHFYIFQNIFSATEAFWPLLEIENITRYVSWNY